MPTVPAFVEMCQFRVGYGAAGIIRNTRLTAEHREAATGMMRELCVCG
jgi:hypothetical protein